MISGIPLHQTSIIITPMRISLNNNPRRNARIGGRREIRERNSLSLHHPQPVLLILRNLRIIEMKLRNSNRD